MAASVSDTPVGPSVTLRSGLATDVRAVAAVVAAGLVLGVAVNGIGSRLAMLLLARLNPAATGRLSDDGFRMGQFDPGATLSLLSFTTAVGVLGGLVYLAVRPLRFGPRWFVLAAMAVGPAVVVGNLLVHVDGVDFTILHPAWLAISLFVVLPGLFGLSMAVLAERWLAPDGWFATTRLRNVVPLMVPLLLPHLLVVAAVAVAGVRSLQAVSDRWPRGGQALRWLGRAGLVAIVVVSLVELVRKTAILT